MSEVRRYRVEGMSCGHCTAAVERELRALPGVAAVETDLEAKLVEVHGDALDDETLRAAIENAGYTAAR